jgi:AsmA-like C-terminal region
MLNRSVVEPRTETDPPRQRGRRWIWAFSGLIAAVVIVLAMLAAAVPLSSDTLRHRVVATLSQRLDSDVALGDLHLRVFPSVRAEGSSLVIWKRGRDHVPPLIRVKRFTADGDLLRLWRGHVTHVQLEGLDIEIPPKDQHGDDDHARPAAESGDAPAAIPTTGEAEPSSRGTGADARDFDTGVVVDAMDTVDARLAIISSDSGKPPKVWAVHTLHLEKVGIRQAMPYQATLTNGIPRGEIATKGSFGPWQRKEPGDTPLAGTYTFDHADLSIFNGISGTLSSRGEFGGTLARIDATGETDTPDFTISVGGQPFPLHTKFHSIIDGTNGNTLLERIDASFLQSSLVARGGVVDTRGKEGRTVSLDIVMDRARIEDIMKMAVRTPKPPMAGALHLVTKFLLPPGKGDVVERLQLSGRFAIARARFTNYDVQAKIDELSRRGRGRKPDAVKDRVASNFEGRFRLAAGALHLPVLQFAVPGAVVKLAGTYLLKRETLDFRGSLLLDAKISETQTGIKSLLLKVVDPFFRRDGGGSSVPIRITGPRNEPSFGLDRHRLFRRGDTP